MALPLSRQRYEFGQRKVIAPALVSSRKWVAGDFFLDAGQAIFYNGLKEADVGDEVLGTYVGTFEVPSASATTIANGADVFYDTANRLAVASSGAGIILLGKAVVAKTNGQTSVLVRLNAL